MIVLTSERYRVRPLVVMGPGAGVDVTAMGVLGDILRIAAERR
jgi:aspartokinase/homoserine dehydrogenase 1